jgi:hypothetical protein
MPRPVMYPASSLTKNCAADPDVAGSPRRLNAIVAMVPSTKSSPSSHTAPIRGQDRLTLVREGGC